MRLVADRVVLRYPRAVGPVLVGADLEVEEGESVAILGPSGSGKSTLLSVLGGLLRPTAGSVRVEDARPDDYRGLKDVSAWVLQTVNVFPERSALENVAVAGLTRGLTMAAAHDDAAGRLREVGLGDQIGAPARLLSGGEVQRIVIARALASGRPFILADEPTGQLDHATSNLVLEALFTAAGGAGLVVVTHDAEVAARCGRMARIEDGVVIAA